MKPYTSTINSKSKDAILMNQKKCLLLMIGIPKISMRKSQLMIQKRAIMIVKYLKRKLFEKLMIPFAMTL